MKKNTEVTVRSSSSEMLPIAFVVHNDVSGWLPFHARSSSGTLQWMSTTPMMSGRRIRAIAAEMMGMSVVKESLLVLSCCIVVCVVVSLPPVGLLFRMRIADIRGSDDFYLFCANVGIIREICLHLHEKR